MQVTLDGLIPVTLLRWYTALLVRALGSDLSPNGAIVLGWGVFAVRTGRLALLECKDVRTGD